MKFFEDPRAKAGRKGFALAWIYFTIYVAVIMVLSFTLGNKPYVWGLPRWVAIGNVVIPVVFVGLLIWVVEKLMPDIPLTDSEDSEKEE
ncbi:MAG: DUF997 family protein [Candidatus Aminicenantes bacterium]